MCPSVKKKKKKSLYSVNTEALARLLKLLVPNDTCIGFVLWYFSNCWSFNAKSFLYVYIQYIISKHIWLIKVFDEPELSFSIN